MATSAGENLHPQAHRPWDTNNHENFLFTRVNLFGGCIIIEAYCVVDSGEFKHVHDLRVESAASFFLPLKSSSVPLHIFSQVVGVLLAFYQVGVAGRIVAREAFQAVRVETVQSRLKEVAEVSVSVVWIGAEEENIHKHQQAAAVTQAHQERITPDTNTTTEVKGQRLTERHIPKGEKFVLCIWPLQE